MTLGLHGPFKGLRRSGISKKNNDLKFLFEKIKERRNSKHIREITVDSNTYYSKTDIIKVVSVYFYNIFNSLCRQQASFTSPPFLTLPPFLASKIVAPIKEEE